MYIDPSGKLQAHQVRYCFLSWIDDVDETLVHLNLKMFLESLSMCGERVTQYTLRSVGNGMGPATFAPVLLATSTMRFADWSSNLWSYERSLCVFVVL